MPVHVRARGDYEVFESAHHHRILTLNHRQWYVWLRGDIGPILVRTDSNHDKKRTLRRGRFFYVEFVNDPKFKDMPHLFLEQDGKYREYLLPNGLPTADDPQKRIVTTRHTIARDELEKYLRHPAPAGPDEERLRGHMRRPGGASMANIAHYLRGIDFPATRSELIRHAERRRAPKAALSELKKIAAKQYASMAEVTKAIHAAHAASGTEREVPIPNLNQLPVELARKRLRRLAPDALRRLKSYESADKHRKTLLHLIDRRLAELRARA